MNMVFDRTSCPRTDPVSSPQDGASAKNRARDSLMMSSEELRRKTQEAEAAAERTSSMERSTKRDADIGLVSVGLGDVMLTPLLITAMKQAWELGRRIGIEEGKRIAGASQGVFMKGLFETLLSPSNDKKGGE